MDLRSATQLPEQVDDQTRRDAPTFLKADKTQGQPDLKTTLEGRVELRRADTFLRADRVEYNAATDALNAQGQVLINRAGNTFEGPQLQLQVDAFEGELQDPVFAFLRTRSRGYAKRLVFQGPKKVSLEKAVYSSCQTMQAGQWLPDWFLKAERITLDEGQDEGRIEGGSLYFKGLPILPVPSFGFPMSGKRRSGWLPPSMVVDNQNGLTINTPYYWNIAPDRDLIVTPERMSLRGNRLMLDGRQLQSLTPRQEGAMHLELMPDDQLRQRERWALSAKQNAQFQVQGRPMSLAVDVNRVSDDNYWRDFTGSPGALSQRLLPTSTQASVPVGPAQLAVRTANWQVLQDFSETGGYITPPYDLAPQLTLNHSALNVSGFDVVSQVQATQFKSARWYDCTSAPNGSAACQPDAQRTLFKGKLSHPLVRPYGYINPQLLVHARSYRFDRTGLGMPASSAYSQLDSAQVTVPSLVLDSGLYFDRATQWGNREWLQTLEPRLYVVNTPYRQQSQIPLYDSALADFNFASIFSPNVFAGEDRIADNRMVTLGATSRWIDPQTGAQALQLGIAQRNRLVNQRVTLLSTDPVVKERLSDLMLGASAELAHRTTVDAISQYSPDENRSLRTSLSVRHQPGHYKVINASYSQQRTTTLPSELINTSWQWPMPSSGLAGSGQWYSVGRLNYSSTDRRIVNALMGVEFDAGCWVGRVVIDRQQTALSTFNQRLMFELSLNGFSRVGISPLGALQTQIPNYQRLNSLDNEPVSRFDRYE